MISHTFQHSSTIQLRSGPSSEAPKLSTVYILSIVICEALALLIHLLLSSQCQGVDRYLVEIVEYTETVWDSAAVRQCHCVWRDRGPRATAAQYGQAEIQGDTWSTLVQASSAIFTAILSEWSGEWHNFGFHS